MNGEHGYFHLNLANQWPTFELHNLEAPEGELTLIRVEDQTFATNGLFHGGPFEAMAGPTPWYRLQVQADSLPENTHLQLFTFTTSSGDAPPYDPTSNTPFPGAGWQAAPRDQFDILILNPPAQYLWIGGIVYGDGQATPAISQMRVTYGRDTHLTSLPALYARGDVQPDLLERVLSLHQSVLGGLERKISDLPRLFDPFAAPDDDYPSWLAWLAGWLAFDLSEAWSEAETRRYLAEAFQLYGQRGTVAGLRRYLKLYAGVEAHIEEPALQTSLWSLGETSTLGFSTQLAPAHLQGAVVGTSATLDQSHLTRDDDFGPTLFDDLAHRFCVQVYCAELTRPGALADARAVIEREKPAHTDYHLCVIEPRMRVGVQARVGLDTIVAGTPSAAQVGLRLDTGILAEAAETCKPGTVITPSEITICEDEEESDYAPD